MNENSYEYRLLRLPQVLEKIPISRSTFLKYVSEGRFPKPIKMGGKISFWKEDDIDDLVNRIVSGEF